MSAPATPLVELSRNDERELVRRICKLQLLRFELTDQYPLRNPFGLQHASTGAEYF